MASVNPCAYCGGMGIELDQSPRRTVSPSAYVWVSRFALILLCIIVVSGAAVRLSGSGLGCSDWPRCNSERFIDVSTTHGAIEQVNRLFTGLVTVIVIGAVLAARYRHPYRKDLMLLAWGLVIGVVGQIVLGGIVVLTDLNPVANQGHFLLSMFLVANALILHKRAGHDQAPVRESTIPRKKLSRQQAMTRFASAVGALAIVTGTVVTGAGPHAGDENSPRLDFDIASVARLHGIFVFVTIVALAVLALDVQRRKVSGLLAPLEIVLVVAVLQATVGYIQYFNNIPALLVGVHVFGATMFFLALVNLWLASNQIERDNVSILDRNSLTVR